MQIYVSTVVYLWVDALRTISRDFFLKVVNGFLGLLKVVCLGSSKSFLWAPQSLSQVLQPRVDAPALTSHKQWLRPRCKGEARQRESLSFILEPTSGPVLWVV